MSRPTPIRSTSAYAPDPLAADWLAFDMWVSPPCPTEEDGQEDRYRDCRDQPDKRPRGCRVLPRRISSHSSAVTGLRFSAGPCSSAEYVRPLTLSRFCGSVRCSSLPGWYISAPRIWARRRRRRPRPAGGGSDCDRPHREQQLEHRKGPPHRQPGGDDAGPLDSRTHLDDGRSGTTTDHRACQRGVAEPDRGRSQRPTGRRDHRL